MHNHTGTVIGMLHIMPPFLILPAYGALLSIDRDYMKAAANLGASPTRAFWTVFFPLSLPGLIAGSLLVFILCSSPSTSRPRCWAATGSEPVRTR